MENKDLKSKTIFGIIWKFSERFLVQVISLFISIFLARLLSPEDYSVVGIVTIFFSFANVFISGGFNAALIQRKEVDVRDYSSVFTITMVISVLLYIVLFFVSPYIAELYKQPILVPIFRVMGIVLLLNALSSVLNAYISNTMQFKKFFMVSIIGTILSGIIGIIMAFNGFGSWSLVAHHMSSSFFTTVALVIISRMRLKLKIFKDNIYSLFKYGWKVLVTSLITVVYDEINPLIIGVKFSGADLSYYTKGKSFPKLAGTTVSDTFSSVLFPAMSKIQDDEKLLLSYSRRFMKSASFIIFPIMFGFVSVANQFVSIILTEKWLPAAIYIQAFCVVYMFDLINIGNLQVIRAIGRSDIMLILEIIKKTIYAVVIFLFVTLTNKPQYLALACIINALLACVINAIPNRKLIGYKILMQIEDVLPNLISAILMAIVVYSIGLLTLNIYLVFVLQIVSGVSFYIFINLLIKNPSMNYFLNTIKGFIKK